MCGFLAAFGDGLPAHRKQLLELGKLLQHRGPDSSRIVSGNNYLFLFHRLAIQDPLARSDQPMSDPSARYTLVFNGEIYNYRELRQTLATGGIQFRTTSDTEVLLQGLITAGQSFLKELEGMYSFVFWDHTQKSLLAARDPFGIKPLYYVQHNDVLVFSSESPPLRLLTNDSVNPEQLVELLVFRHTPKCASPYHLVKSLAGGNCLYGSPRQPVERTFADPLSFLESTADDISCCEDETSVYDSLVRTFRKHARSDVGYALQISGGVDSSFLAAICASFNPRQLESYGAAFPGSPYDEKQFRDEVVKAYQLRHHEISITAEDFADAFPRVIAALDAPSPHYGCVALYLLCQQVGAAHKVILTGEGADELFGGYSRYSRVSEYAPIDPDEPSGEPAEQSVIFASLYTSLAEIKSLFPGLSYHFTERARIAARFSGTLRQMQALDYHCYLPSLLMRQDRVAMAHGVEARVPYVDLALIRSVGQLPHHRKGSTTRTKPLLKNLASRYLGESLIERRKIGLLIPVRSWLRSERLLGRYVSSLTEPSARLAAFTDRQRLRTFVDMQLRQDGNETSSTLMQVLNVELWLRSLECPSPVKEAA